MNTKVRIGLVGADASGRGWGPVAHIPALRAVEDVELAALCTSRPDSARAAGEAYGVSRTYHDVSEMAADPDIDAVAVVVRVPLHHRVVMPALEAGKHVFCEWPLGANTGEADEMADLARSKGVVTAIGLQGRQDPGLTHVRELVETGWLGDVVSVRVSLVSGGGLTKQPGEAWMGQRLNGANTMSIVGGHTIDYVEYCVGPLTELSARVETQMTEWNLGTGEVVAVDAPDHVLVNATLAGGGLLSFQVASVPFHGPGWRMELYGTRGTIVASTPVMPQITPITLLGAQGSQSLAPIEAPAADARLPEGPARNIALAYRSMANAVREGTGFAPDFEHARRLHELLDAMVQSSREGTSVGLARH